LKAQAEALAVEAEMAKASEREKVRADSFTAKK